VQRQENIKSYVVPAGSYLPLSFGTGGNEGGRIVGRFEAQGGTGNDIELYIMDEDSFTNWKNGHASEYYYQSGRRTVGEFNVGVAAGNFYIVLSNTFSSSTPKAVTLTIR
jgi:hypothetical protein